MLLNEVLKFDKSSVKLGGNRHDQIFEVNILFLSALGGSASFFVVSGLVAGQNQRLFLGEDLKLDIFLDLWWPSLKDFSYFIDVL